MRPLQILLPLLLAWQLMPGQTLDDFFDGTQLQEIRIETAPADWASIKEKYLENTYYRCDFAWKGIKVEGIGMRSRGSQSRSPIKPSIGLDFSRYTSAQRFLGLKTLVLRNLNQDASMMHERLAESLFRRVGLVASREAHARLYVNGEYVGVYLLVEPADEHMLRTRVGEDGGYLYEVNDTSPNFKFEYRGPDPATYIPSIFDPKTRTSDPETRNGIVEMIRRINESPDEKFVEEVGQYVDLPAFLMHAAAEQVLAQWDGVLGSSGLNNFYLYRFADGRMGMPIVWDQDGAFSDINFSIWRETDQDVLFRRSLQIPELRKLYLDAVRQCAAALGGEGGWMDREVERIYQQIRQAVQEDPVRLCRVADAPGGIGACTLKMFEDDVLALRDFARRRAGIVLAEAGKVEEELWIDPSGLEVGLDSSGVVVPGSIGAIKVKMPWTAAVAAQSVPLPQSLGGAQLQSSEGLAELFLADPKALVFRVPDPWRMGSRPVWVQYGGKKSNALMIRVGPTAAAVLNIVHNDWRAVNLAARARPGQALTAFVLAAWPGWPNGPAGGLSVRIGGVDAPILWSGGAPGWIGLQQVNFQVPASGLGVGTHGVQILYEGEASPAFAIPVE